MNETAQNNDSNKASVGTACVPFLFFCGNLFFCFFKSGKRIEKGG